MNLSVGAKSPLITGLQAMIDRITAPTQISDPRIADYSRTVWSIGCAAEKLYPVLRASQPVRWKDLINVLLDVVVLPPISNVGDLHNIIWCELASHRQIPLQRVWIFQIRIDTVSR